MAGAPSPSFSRGDPLGKLSSLTKTPSLPSSSALALASKACSPGSGERNRWWELDRLPKTTQQDLGAGNVSALH